MALRPLKYTKEWTSIHTDVYNKKKQGLNTPAS